MKDVILLITNCFPSFWGIRRFFFSAILITLLIFLGNSISFAQPTFVWAKSIGGSGADWGHSIAVDGSDNIYTTGYFEGTVDFDPGAGTYNLISAGFNDIFVSKLDASGNFVWAIRMGGNSYDVGIGIALDDSGNVYITGFFSDTVDFNPGAGTYNLISAGSRDIFVSKLDASGNFVWAIRMGGNFADDGNSIAVDDSGNVYTTGYFMGTADFDPGAGTYNLSSPAFKWDIFVSKLDSSGNFVWARKMGGNDHDEGYSIAVDDSGNVHTTGYFTGTVDFDPGAGTYNLISAGTRDIFASKLDASGNFVWAKKMGGDNNHEEGTSIVVDGSSNVYTTGIFNDTVDFDPGAGTYNLISAGLHDIFVSKLDASGNFVWAIRMGDISNDRAYGIALDVSNNIFIIGDQYSDTVDYDPGAGVYNVNNTGSEAIFIAQYDNNSNFLCAFSIAPGHNETHYNRHIAVSGSNVYCIISINDSVTDFDPCPPVSNVSNNGDYDIAVAKYDFSACSCPPLPIELLSFNAYAKTNQLVKTEWVTATETNNDYFTVLRSKDGYTFVQIGTVPGAGNSNTTLNYEFYDQYSYTGLNYYQLKQTDYNGASSLSNIEIVYISPLSIVNVYPNLADNTVNVVIGSPDDIDVSVLIFNSIGQKVMETVRRIETGISTITLNVQNLASGNYLFRVTTPAGETVENEFIIR